MEELDLNHYLFKQNLFDLFKFQLIKDFESAGLEVSFADNLPKELNDLKNILQLQIDKVSKRQPHLLPILLYRIDISELQIKAYAKRNPNVKYESLLSELIIKRLLQKVILKKTFSNK